LKGRHSRCNGIPKPQSARPSLLPSFFHAPYAAGAGGLGGAAAEFPASPAAGLQRRDNTGAVHWLCSRALLDQPGCIPCGSACTLGRREAGTLSLSRFLTNTSSILPWSSILARSWGGRAARGNVTARRHGRRRIAWCARWSLNVALDADRPLRALCESSSFQACPSGWSLNR
jgi:hypothetical protein